MLEGKKDFLCGPHALPTPSVKSASDVTCEQMWISCGTSLLFAVILSFINLGLGLSLVLLEISVPCVH